MVRPVAMAHDIYELEVSEDSPRRQRWRWFWSFIAGAATDGAASPAEDIRDVRLLRRADGSVVIEQAGVFPDVVGLLVRDWETLDVEHFEERWRPSGGRLTRGT
jgi:hypothetical protein